MMDLYIDARNANLKLEENRNAFIAQCPDYLKTTEPEKIEDFKRIFGKKRYLFSTHSDTLVYIIFNNTSSVASFASKSDGKTIYRGADTLSGFLFEKDVPTIIKIRGDQYGFEMAIKTFGKRMVVLDIPLLLTASVYTSFSVSFDKECKFRYIYDLYKPDIRRIIGTTHMECVYDGTILRYTNGICRMFNFIRPLKNIIQDLVQDMNIETNPLLMRRSNRDAKALAGPSDIVFEP